MMSLCTLFLLLQLIFRYRYYILLCILFLCVY